MTDEVRDSEPKFGDSEPKFGKNEIYNSKTQRGLNQRIHGR